MSNCSFFKLAKGTGKVEVYIMRIGGKGEAAALALSLSPFFYFFYLEG